MTSLLGPRIPGADLHSRQHANLSRDAAMCPTPTARMHKGGGNAVQRSDGKSRLDMLDWAAEAWSRSTAPHQTIQGGPKSYDGRRTLNPRFAEWLMGLPPAWTSSGPSETEFTLWLWDMRGELLRLCLPKKRTVLL